MDQPLPTINGPTGASVIATEWILLSIAAFLISARLYLRLKIKRQRLMLSDSFICLAWTFAVAYNSFDILYMRLGALEPYVDSALVNFQTDPETVQTVQLGFWASLIPYYTALYCSKAAVLSFYLQICPEFSRFRRNGIWMVIYYSGAAFVTTMGLIFFLCYPVQRNWAIGENVCPPSAPIILFQVAWSFHFSSDIFIFLVPFLILYRLRMRRIVRIGVYATFTLGAINIIFSLTGFLTLQLAVEDDSIVPPSLTQIELWSAIDCNIGVIVATLPSLRPYLRMVYQGSSARSGRQVDGIAASDYHLNKRGFSRIGQAGAVEGTMKAKTKTTVAGTQEEWDLEDHPTGEAAPRSDVLTETGSEVELVEVMGTPPPPSPLRESVAQERY
ncbi:hypothetical protein GQ53DRAFT_868376 [Thozetella sp. PMI_491]|nr:hypothetical protein GQ53DRAFT_868376 [Thozetella sp. PMI_491]